MLKGHARIYGDDKEIWREDRYIGETAKPWVLNENFFNGKGTIVIGVAMKHENPFVQLFGLWGQSDPERAMVNKSIFSAFNPPSPFSLNGVPYSNNFIWAMSAARAGVRHARRDGKCDKARMYQVVYDGTSDPRNMKIKAPFKYVKSNPQEPGKWEAYNDGNSVEKLGEESVVGGCVCEGNKEKLAYMWNLCEQDWDATLLPLRYAGSAAVMQTPFGALSDLNYSTRKTALDSINAQRDSDYPNDPGLRHYPGNGANWVWSPAKAQASDVGNENPMNPANQDMSWKPLDPENAEYLNLKNLLPGGKVQLDLSRILKQNRIL